MLNPQISEFICSYDLLSPWDLFVLSHVNILLSVLIMFSSFCSLLEAWLVESTSNPDHIGSLSLPPLPPLPHTPFQKNFSLLTCHDLLSLYGNVVFLNLFKETFCSSLQTGASWSPFFWEPLWHFLPNVILIPPVLISPTSSCSSESYFFWNSWSSRVTGTVLLILTCKLSSESSWRLVKTPIPGVRPGVSNSTSLQWRPKICISNNSQVFLF